MVRALLLLPILAAAVDYAPLGTLYSSESGSGSWDLGPSYSPFSMAFADRVIFNFSTIHTVNVSPSCSPVGTQLSLPGASSYIFDPAQCTACLAMVC